MFSDNDLTAILLENFDFFRQVSDSNVGNFCQTFQVFGKTIEILQLKVDEIEGFAALYDFSETSPGNGYRSFIYVYNAALNRAKDVCILIQKNRERLLFRKRFYEKYDRFLRSFVIITDK